MNAPDTNAGLDTGEAARRLARDGPNLLPAAERRGLRAIAWQAAREPMFALLLAAGLLYLVLGELHEGILMFALVLATLGMTLYEENRAERALVIRDGHRLRIGSPEVVVGGLRVLAVARAVHDAPAWPGQVRDFGFSLTGLVGFADPLRDGVRGAVGECDAAGAPGQPDGPGASVTPAGQ